MQVPGTQAAAGGRRATRRGFAAARVGRLLVLDSGLPAVPGRGSQAAGGQPPAQVATSGRVPTAALRQAPRVSNTTEMRECILNKHYLSV